MNSAKRLYRSRQRVIAGVCGGLGDYFNIDPVWVRLMFVVLTILGVGITIIFYVIFVLIVPNAPVDNTDCPNCKK